MFGGSWSTEGTSLLAGCSQAPPGHLSAVADAGPLVHVGNATTTGVPVGRPRTCPSVPEAQTSQVSGRAAGKRSYSQKVKTSLDEMAQLLEIPGEVRVELSDEDIVAMSIQYVKKMTLPGGFHPSIRETDKDIPLDIYLAALDGFVLHVGANGRVRYISQNILEYLGFTAEQMVGRRILDFMHPTDRAELENILSAGFMNNESCQSASNNRVELFLRMRHQYQKQSPVLNNDGYTVIHCVGLVETDKSFHESGVTKRSGLCPSLWVIGRPLKQSFILKYHINMSAFVIRSGLNLQPNFADSEMLRLLGYSAWEFSSSTLYQYIHPSDAVDFRRAHETVLRKGQSLSHYYRMLTKSGATIWMQTQFSLVCNDFSPSPNSIVSLNYVLGGERRIRTFSTPSNTFLNSTAVKKDQFIRQRSLSDTVSCESCKICESECCYDVPNTAPLTTREATLKCDIRDSHRMPSTFSKRSSSHVESNNATHLQLRGVSGEQGQSTHTTTESINNMIGGLPRCNESSSSEYSELLQAPCTYERNLRQSTVDAYARYEEQTCNPERRRNVLACAGNSRTTTSSQLPFDPRSLKNDCNSFSAVSSAFQREEIDSGTESQVTNATRDHSTRDVNYCSTLTQHRSSQTTLESFTNFESQPTVNSFNDMGKSSGLVETYDTKSSTAAMLSNNETLVPNSYQHLPPFENAVDWSYSNQSDSDTSQITDNYNQLLSAISVPNDETSSTSMQTEMNYGSNHGALRQNATSENNIGLCQTFAGCLANSSTDCSTSSSSSFLQQTNACMNQDCSSSLTIDLPLTSDTGVQNTSNDDNFEPDDSILNDVMRQLENRLGINWEIALQKFSGQQNCM